MLRRSRPALALALVLSTASVATQSARADEQDALAAYRHGEEAYKAGDFRGAAQSFERAYKQDPRGATIYNAALAWQAAGELPRAADAYAAAIEALDLPQAFATDARAKLTAIEKSLARVDVSAAVGARVSIAHVRAATAPAHVHVSPGTHDLRVDFANGKSRSQRVTLVAGQALAVDIAAPDDAPAPPPRDPADARDVAPIDREATSVAAPPGSDATTSSGARTAVAWVAIGAGVVLGAASAYFYFDASKKRDDYVSKHDTTGIADASLHDDAQAALTRSWIAGGVALAAAATGVVLLVTAPSKSATSATRDAGRVELGIAPGRITLGGRF